jgi:hypothetical protein
MFVESRGTKYAYRSIGKDPGALSSAADDLTSRWNRCGGPSAVMPILRTTATMASVAKFVHAPK